MSELKQTVDAARKICGHAATQRGHCQASLTVSLPNELLGPFLQHLRDFETRHFDDVTVVMAWDAPDIAVQRFREILEGISPPYGNIAIDSRSEGKPATPPMTIAPKP